MKTVTELARCFNVSADTIRHYSKLGLLSPERDKLNGYRRYRLQDEQRLRFLLSAKKLGFSLKEVQKILATATTGDTPCPLVRKLIESRIAAIRNEMEEAQRLMARMETALDSWCELPDNMPSGASICHLIETWEQGSSKKS
ncbi:MerR family transcriptional regulator [Dasania marina]|uniref:MerR family transcriptional regulator n=1 Tax=Dasania marina TaxID=471499 RepID=UPI00037E72BC|nr:MerR family transcriptional regulator [Dasania marina]